ncbi:hypothetical protein IEO21_02065 [Rhodonia placenta]|uniref:Uncharacterized protein n=1 Tax=Rhodonia placenta TaxID=104341 RepID=A0A8H7P894_9APHY|nr:hypothetical protein IEO21_02065 [Postia placenta]
MQAQMNRTRMAWNLRSLYRSICNYLRAADNTSGMHYRICY